MSDSVAAKRNNVVNTLKTIANFLYQHIIDSTAILMAVTPIYMFLELVIWRFDPLVSFRARRIIVIITYLGTGFLIAKGRDLSKRTFGVDQPNTSERRIVMHDLFFLVAFNAVFAPIIYAISQASLRELILGTLSAMALSVINGPINGFFIDAVGELTGIRESQRLPYRIKALGRTSKLILFFTVLSIMIIVVILIYGGMINEGTNF